MSECGPTTLMSSHDKPVAVHSLAPPGIPLYGIESKNALRRRKMVNPWVGGLAELRHTNNSSSARPLHRTEAKIRTTIKLVTPGWGPGRTSSCLLRALEISSRATATWAALAAGAAQAAEQAQAQQQSFGLTPASAEAWERFSAPPRE